MLQLNLHHSGSHFPRFILGLAVALV
ncbi:hypothetical protein PSEUDO9AG_50694 [Pseudomonas sp. 9Ag]|nr:hypothetical protein PSEUDO9AG_50694 [Pseudomonas sp. 9Ag]